MPIATDPARLPRRGPRGEVLGAEVLGAVVLLCLLVLVSGCGGHEMRVNGVLDALDHDRPARATALLNRELKVETSDALPAQSGGDNALLLLERATVLQSMGRYQQSARSFIAADEAIDVLDLRRDAGHDVARYLFSDNAGPYRAPAFEKLLINSLNMLNFLAQGDLRGARVEARRLEVMQRYLKARGADADSSGLGSYLAGFVYEKSGRLGPAERHYQHSWKVYGLQGPPPVLRQTAAGQPAAGQPAASQPAASQPAASQPAQPAWSALLNAMLGAPQAAEPTPVLATEPAALQTGEPGAQPTSAKGELLLVLGYGRVPRKVPVRVSVGGVVNAYDIHPRDRARAQQLRAKGMTNWLNVPRLGRSRGPYAAPGVHINGEPAGLALSADVEHQLRRDWDKNRATVEVSAFTRWLTRAAAGEATHRGIAASSKSKTAGFLGLMAGLATTATLSAVDTPDTRSWTTLPARIALVRKPLSPGAHDITVTLRGSEHTRRINLKPGGWAVVPIMVLR